MKRTRWVFGITVVVVAAIAACTTTTPTGSGSASSSSGSGGGGNGGAGGAASSSGDASSSSSSSSGSGGGSAFAACTDTTGSLPDCKDCCDCATDLACDQRKVCRDACITLGDAYFMMNPNPMPVNAPSTVGMNGDYSKCTATTTTVQECKACCECSTDWACGDYRFCRDACNALYPDAGPPPSDGG